MFLSQDRAAAFQAASSLARAPHSGPGWIGRTLWGMRTIAALWILAAAAMGAQRVAIVADGQLAAPAKYGLSKLQDSLRAKGFDVNGPAAGADYVIVANLGAPGGREALAIRHSQYGGKPALTLSGGDARGLMYAALDVAERIAWSSRRALPIRPRHHREALSRRARRLHVHHAARVLREPPLRRTVMEALLRHAGGRPDQQFRRDLRLRKRRLHGAAVSVLFQREGIPRRRAGRASRPRSRRAIPRPSKR